MKTASCKAKGRRLQQRVAADLLALGKGYGLEADDIKSTPMASSGVDIQLSPAAQRIFGKLLIECKNVEALNVMSTFYQYAEEYKDKGILLLVHSKNKTEPLVTMKWQEFFPLLAGLAKIIKEQNEKYDSTKSAPQSTTTERTTETLS